MASKKRKLPPWGDLFDGKPIERDPRRDPIYGGPDKDALDEQFRRMCRLKEHYGIERSGWYELALAIASELDASLTIDDPQLCQVARRRCVGVAWRGCCSWRSSRPSAMPCAEEAARGGSSRRRCSVNCTWRRRAIAVCPSPPSRRPSTMRSANTRRFGTVRPAQHQSRKAMPKAVVSIRSASMRRT